MAIDDIVLREEDYHIETNNTPNSITTKVILNPEKFIPVFYVVVEPKDEDNLLKLHNNSVKSTGNMIKYRGHFKNLLNEYEPNKRQGFITGMQISTRQDDNNPTIYEISLDLFQSEKTNMKSKIPDNTRIINGKDTYPTFLSIGSTNNLAETLKIIHNDGVSYTIERLNTYIGDANKRVSGINNLKPK